MRVGIGGPVGTGKSSLDRRRSAGTCRPSSQLGVVTNDIYTTEDAEFLRSTGVLPAGPDHAPCRPAAAPTPRSATTSPPTSRPSRTSSAHHGPLDIVFVESGGDNLTAVFGPALADVQIFVLDCAGGDDVPRKGGPGIARADLLVINKTDLAPLVGADVSVMLEGARGHRGDLPVYAISLRHDGAAEIADWLRHQLRHHRAGSLRTQDVGSPVPHVHIGDDGSAHAHQH